MVNIKRNQTLQQIAIQHVYKNIMIHKFLHSCHVCTNFHFSNSSYQLIQFSFLNLYFVNVFGNFQTKFWHKRGKMFFCAISTCFKISTVKIVFNSNIVHIAINDIDSYKLLYLLLVHFYVMILNISLLDCVLGNTLLNG